MYIYIYIVFLLFMGFDTFNLKLCELKLREATVRWGYINRGFGNRGLRVT